MRWYPMLLVAVALLSGCSKEQPQSQVRPPAEVTVLKVAPRDTPVSYEFVGQTQSSRQVQIVARVNGFLERRVYEEGSLVKAGQLLFEQDPKPFQASLDAAKGALASEQARLQTARENLARVKPLAALNALSKKDLDDATGNEQAAAAAVDTARANVLQAQLNLSYTRIESPVTGLSSFARVQEGSYVGPENSLLTYVARVDPIWVNFTLSENELLGIREQSRAGNLRLPPKDQYQVEVILANGETLAEKGRITFENPDFDAKTGSFLLRATIANPKNDLRPGMFVRVRVLGAVRPNAILVPQQAVLQGAKGHFVIVVDNESKAQIRPVLVGSWYRDDWFIEKGLEAGDVVVVDGMVKLSPGVSVKPLEAPIAPAAGSVQSRAAAASVSAPGGAASSGPANGAANERSAPKK